MGEVTAVLNVTEKDLAEANEIAERFTLDDTRRVCDPGLLNFLAQADEVAS